MNSKKLKTLSQISKPQNRSNKLNQEFFFSASTKFNQLADLPCLPLMALKTKCPLCRLCWLENQTLPKSTISLWVILEIYQMILRHTQIKSQLVCSMNRLHFFLQKCMTATLSSCEVSASGVNTKTNDNTRHPAIVTEGEDFHLPGKQMLKFGIQTWSMRRHGYCFEWFEGSKIQA